MKPYLLDVSVLLALLWPKHRHHDAAQTWFAKSGHASWATCPLTQLGAIRLLTNPAISQGTVDASSALDSVIEATKHEGHTFWPLERFSASDLKPFTLKLQGYRQWTDAVLLWQTVRRDGMLATFDSGIKELAGVELSNRVALLKS